jgi:protease-4
MASAFRKMEKEDRDILQGVLENVHEQFIRAVAEGRKLTIEEIRPVADGRIFTGEQAKGLRLVDELGTLENAVKKAGELAGISGEPEVVSKEDKLSFMELLRSKVPREIADMFPSVKLKFLYIP